MAEDAANLLFTVGHSNHECAKFLDLLTAAPDHGGGRRAVAALQPVHAAVQSARRWRLRWAGGRSSMSSWARNLGARREERECYVGGKAAVRSDCGVAGVCAGAGAAAARHADAAHRHDVQREGPADVPSDHPDLPAVAGGDGDSSTSWKTARWSSQAAGGDAAAGVDGLAGGGLVSRPGGELVERAYDQQGGGHRLRRTARGSRAESGAMSEAVHIFTIGFTRKTAEAVFYAARTARV